MPNLLEVLGIKPGKGGASTDHPDHPDHMTHEERLHHGHLAMKEFHEAVQRGDHAAMSAALRAHHAVHDNDGDEYDHEEPDGDEA